MPVNKKSIRVSVPNVVYLTNLPPTLNESILMLPEFLGLYGSLEKVVVHKNKSAHVVYRSPESATLCMIYLNGFNYDGTIISALEGTTKYAEDVDLKALRIASLKEPIRPVPKKPVFPLPRSYLGSRPACLEAHFIGTGTLVDKTWHNQDTRLSPGSINSFKSCFVPNENDLNYHSSERPFANTWSGPMSTYSQVTSDSPPPGFNHLHYQQYQQQQQQYHDNYYYNQGGNDNNNALNRTMNSTDSSITSFSSTSGNDYMDFDDDFLTPRGIADIGDDHHTTTIDTKYKQQQQQQQNLINNTNEYYSQKQHMTSFNSTWHSENFARLL